MTVYLNVYVVSEGSITRLVILHLICPNFFLKINVLLKDVLFTFSYLVITYLTAKYCFFFFEMGYGKWERIEVKI